MAIEDGNEVWNPRDRTPIPSGRVVRFGKYGLVMFRHVLTISIA
jgi:hypothetical protein